MSMYFIVIFDMLVFENFFNKLVIEVELKVRILNLLVFLMFLLIFYGGRES